ncbi:MAG: hypothetical protein PHE49_02430 [bacterium]|nr:hypothetical protein [bacterium]
MKRVYLIVVLELFVFGCVKMVTPQSIFCIFLIDKCDLSLSFRY